MSDIQMWLCFCLLVAVLAAVYAHVRISGLESALKQQKEGADWQEKFERDRYYRVSGDIAETQASLTKLAEAQGYKWTEGSGSGWVDS